MYTNLKLQIWRSRVHQNRMAQEIQMDEAVLSRIINGYREPSAEQRRKIAVYLEADEDWLFARDVALVKRKNPIPQES
jgi:transcriptional regulator with XRE-family HTH domain